MATTSSKPVVLSGIQPSGRLHIGNYLGALKNFVALQNSGQYQPYFCIVDLHSLTEPFEPAEKTEQIIDLAASYLAAGLDPNQSTLFIQSQVPAHSQLAWILSTLTPMGELERMTQYKDKAGRMDTNAGLFTYPILMAADIMLYHAGFIPVGDDQDQHLELTRTLVRKFNNRFGETFIEPKALHTETPRVMSLADPEKKMSKSSPSGCLFLDDEPAVIEKKIMSAVTDSGSEVSFDEQGKPGIANLLRIASAFSGKPIADLEAEFKHSNYGQFKAAVAQIIIEALNPIRTRKMELLKDTSQLLAVFSEGAVAANTVANQTLAAVYKKVGLV